MNVRTIVRLNQIWRDWLPAIVGVVAVAAVLVLQLVLEVHP